MRLVPDAEGYPRRLLALPDPPKALTTTGPLDAPGRIVAIVGSRRAVPESTTFAFLLAYQLAKAGVVVVSGGALGVDAAAHRGALAAGGVTWSVLPCGRTRCTPIENLRLFQAITLSRGGRLLFPFKDERAPDRTTPRYRNGVLTALADAVVVVQAHFRSGSLNAAGWARQLHKDLWMVPAAPWNTAFCGSNLWVSRGLARAASAPSDLLTALVGRPTRWTPPAPSATGYLAELAALPVEEPSTPELPPEAAPGRRAARPARRRRTTARPEPSAPRTPAEMSILSALSDEPIHVDAIASRARLGVSATVTALLTLALEDVVVEGPDGFFRLQIAG